MGRRYFLIFLARKTFRPTFFFFWLGLLAVFFFSALFRLPDGRFHVRFLDVGQGDSILVTTESNQQILIDGGPSNRVAGLVSNFLPFSASTIDLVILTHPHADHLTGLLYVLRRFKVRNLILEAESYESSIFKQFLAEVKKQEATGMKVFKVKKGDVLTLGKLTIRILWPPSADDLAKSTNNDSVVTLLSYGDFDVFLPGDEEVVEAEKMLSQVKIEPVEVLKVAHHGSANALNSHLLEVLRPNLAVISVGGGNAYGQPSSKILSLLEKYSVSLRRTDLNATIDLTSDGHRWSVKSEK